MLQYDYNQSAQNLDDLRHQDFRNFSCDTFCPTSRSSSMIGDKNIFSQFRVRLQGNVDHADGSLTSQSPHTSVMWSAKSSLSSLWIDSCDILCPMIWYAHDSDVLFHRTLVECTLRRSTIITNIRRKDVLSLLSHGRNYHPFMMSSDVSSCGVSVIFSTVHLWNYWTDTSIIRSATHCWINVWRTVRNSSPNFPFIWNIPECVLINDALSYQLSVHQRVLQCPLSEKSRSHQQFLVETVVRTRVRLPPRWMNEQNPIYSSTHLRFWSIKCISLTTWQSKFWSKIRKSTRLETQTISRSHQIVKVIYDFDFRDASDTYPSEPH